MTKTETSIRSYYTRNRKAGQWLALGQIVANLDIAPIDLQDTLRAMYRNSDVSLIAEENQKALTAENRAAAILIGGQPVHLLAIG